MRTPVGALYVVASADALRGVFFDRQPVALVKALTAGSPVERMLAKAVRQLKEYFEGKRKSFDIALDLTGTPFQKRVWKELSMIPFGQTASYRTVARKIKNPNAVRAVGSANGKNPACIIVPCHRVIAADGSIGGYSGGLRIKRQLLALENISLPS